MHQKSETFWVAQLRASSAPIQSVMSSGVLGGGTSISSVTIAGDSSTGAVSVTVTWLHGQGISGCAAAASGRPV